MFPALLYFTEARCNMQYCALKRHSEMILQCCSAVFYKGTVLLEVLWFGVAQYVLQCYILQRHSFKQCCGLERHSMACSAIFYKGTVYHVMQCYILQRHSVSYDHLIMQCYILQRHYGFCSAIFNRGTVGKKIVY